MHDHADIPDSDKALVLAEHPEQMNEPGWCMWANGVHPGGIAPEHCPCTFPGNQLPNQDW